ncbi:MAG: hypothetical protein IH589_10595 [Anaerolineales bacterium]|nr:hypothetical protein [Anaerolineales bacterium]
MSQIKSEILVGTFLLSAGHILLSWLIYKHDKNKVWEDIRRFGAEFAFIGISFFVSALLDDSSRFYSALKIHSSDQSIQAIVGISLFSFSTLFFFDILAIFLYKTYEQNKRQRGNQRWRLWVSYVLGIATLGIGVSMI